jgi:DNA-binding protein Fis
MSNLIELNVHKALYAARGSVTLAAEMLRIQRGELTKHVAERPHLQDFVFNLREEVADDCQAELGEAVDAGSPWAVKYTLKSIGASRGYVEGAAQPQVAQVAANPDRSTPDNNDNAAQKEKEAQLLAHLPEHAVAHALEQAKGHVAQAAKSLGIPRSFVRKVIELCPNLQEVLFQEREKLVDRAEDVLRDAVRAKKPWAIIFVLDTRGRNRGFGRPARPSRRQRIMANAFPAPVGPSSDEFAAAAPEPLNEIVGRVESSRPADPACPSEPSNEIVGRVESSRPADPAGANENRPAHQPASPLKAPAAQNKKPLSEVLNRIGAELASKQPIKVGPEPVARNAPCPCNSGMKFKRCCGR